MGPDETMPERVSLARLKRSRAFRRAGLAAFAAIFVLGLSNALGVALARASAEGEGYALEVTYARVTRPGLETPWIVRVAHPEGFTGPLELSTSAAYFEHLDVNAMHPEPQSANVRGELLLLEFAEPEGQVFTLRLDARTSPSYSGSVHAQTALELPSGRGPSVHYRTIVMP